MLNQDIKIEEFQYKPAFGPSRLVGLEPGPDRKVRVIEVQSLEHALFVILEGEDKGTFVPVWIENPDGHIICATEELYVELRNRQAKLVRMPPEAEN